MDYSAQKIRDIEDAITRVNSQIQIINKERLHRESRIEKILQMAIPKIKQKIHDSIFEDKKFRTSKTVKLERQKNSMALKEEKIVQGLKIARSRNLLHQQKSQGSKQIRALSRLNEENIRYIKQKQIEEKKRRNLEVREKMEQSRSMIRNFHLQKKAGLKNNKQRQKAQVFQKLQQLAKNLSFRYEQKQKIQKKKQNNSIQFEKMKQIISYLNQMKKKQFLEISEKTGLCKQVLTLSDIEFFIQTLSNSKENINKS